jgi:Family of unknown function (DUF6326)
MAPSVNRFEEYTINIKLRLAALWTAVMFCYVYGDFFSLFVPGRIQSMMNGHSGAGDTTPVKLLLFALLMTIPALMIFGSLMLKARASRLANIIAGIFFTAVMILVVAVSIDKWMLFYTWLGLVEIVITCLIVWQAWRWPRQN